MTCSSACTCAQNKDRMKVRYQTIRKTDEYIEAKVIVELVPREPEVIIDIIEITTRKD